MNKTCVLALLPLFVVLAHSFPWEIVVAAGNRLQFYKNRALTHTEDNPSYKEIFAVTYDPVHYRVLFADHHLKNMTISSFDLTTMEIQTLVTRLTRASHKSLAYDPVTQLLFWGEDKEIYSISLKHASSNTAAVENLVVTLDDNSKDIAVDSCGGYIYWATRRKIERAAFNGSERAVIIDTEVFSIRSLAIDLQTQRMYWSREIIKENYCIQSADLNGKNGTTFYSIGTEHAAAALVVSKDFIYWRSSREGAILQISKHQPDAVLPIVYSIYRRLNPWCQITAANYSIEEQALGMKSCDALKNLIRNSSVKNSSYVSLEDSTCHNYCFKGNCSTSAEGQPQCSCEAGYSGERCEFNVCYKHCLHGGVCILNEEEEPACQCVEDYDGERCEVSASRDNCVRAEGQTNSSCSAGNSGERHVNACHQYCLNDGVCSLNEVSEPVCQCPGDYEGDRCDVPAFITKFFLYAYKNIPPATLCKGVKSTCVSTVV